VDGVIATAWVPAVVGANALRRIGDKRIKMVGIDHDKVVLQAVKDGYLLGTMLQNPYGQAYIGSFAVDKLRHGCKVKADAPWKKNALTGRFIDSGTAFAGPEEVDDYVASMQKVTKEIFASFEKTYLDCGK
jgi:ribose transport system substrate-binding protein